MTKSPDAFRTISEVAELLETPAHVLRFWESRFPQIRPVKRAGGRRYYRPADIALLTGIRHLLHDDGMTIRGVQKILREHGVRHVSGMSDDPGDTSGDTPSGTALTASGGDPEPWPPAAATKVETAQIIAIPTTPRRPEKPHLPDDNTVDTPATRASAAPDQGSAHEEPLSAGSEMTSPPQVLEDHCSSAPATPDTQGEAPMHLWADPDPTPHVPVSAIGTHPVPQMRQETPIAPRLRATKAASLSPSDRATLAILRAKARSLRDRLTSQPRTPAAHGLPPRVQG